MSAFDDYRHRLREQRQAIAAEPIARWYRAADGAEMLLYRDGRWFSRAAAEANWFRIAKTRTLEEAAAFAAQARYDRVDLALEA